MRVGGIKLEWRKITIVLGLAGVATIVVTTVATAMVFSGHDGTTYSMLNHKISALGKPLFSGWATLLNWGLRIGGLLLSGFIIALGFYMARRAMVVVVLAGLVTTSGVVAVGFCPVTQPKCHEVAAGTVFFSGVVTMLAFTVVVLALDQDKLSTWLVVPSGSAVLFFALFVFVLYSRYENPQRAFLRGPPMGERPDLWLPSLLEWLFCSAFAAWVVTIVVDLYRRK